MKINHNVTYFGSFHEFGFGEVLSSLYRQKENGILYVRHDRVIKRIFIENGTPVYVESSLVREGLLRHLYSKDPSRAADLFRVVEKAAGSFDRFFDACMNENLIDGREIPEIFGLLFRNRILEIFQWWEGEYLFVFDEVIPESLQSRCIKVPVEEIIYEGVTKHYRLQLLKFLVREIRDEIPVLEESPAVLRDRFRLDAQDVKLLRRIDGRTPLMDIAALATTDLDSALAFLIFLKTIGAMTFVEETITSDKKMEDLDGEALEFAMLLEKDGREILTKGPFQMLQVNRNLFSEEDVRRGYYTLAQRYHKAGLLENLPAKALEISNAVFEQSSLFFEALIRWVKAKTSGKFEVFIKMAEDLLPGQNLYAGSEIVFLNGLEKFNRGELKEAHGDYRKATQLRPDECEYLLNSVLAEMQLYPDEPAAMRNGLNALQRCVSLDKFCPQVYVAIAECQEQLGQIDDALENVRKASMLSPDDIDIRRRLHEITFKSLSEQQQKRMETEEEKSRLEGIADFVEKHDGKDLYEVLGLEQSATKTEIRHSYFSLAKELHPDTLGRLKTHPMAERAFVLINEAYDILSSDTKRRQYDRGLRAVETHKQYEEMEKKKREMQLLTKAKVLLRDGVYDQSIKILLDILKESPDLLEVKSNLIWAEFNRDVKSSSAARRIAEQKLMEISERRPDALEPHYFLGKIALRFEDYKRAQIHFGKAQHIDPESVEVNRELRLIQQRNRENVAKITEARTEKKAPEPTQDKKGLFGGIFGKKK